jgi:putative two-component system response regulator
VAITDVFDALTSQRPYKKAWPVAQALQFMSDGAGKHFDPTLMRTFVDLVPQVQQIRARFEEPTPPGADVWLDTR